MSDVRFKVFFLEKVDKFMEKLSPEEKEEILARVREATKSNNPRLFEKLNKNIWEFRSQYNGRQFRLLAFWDKTQKAFVVATHGFIKKTQKTPPQEIEKAEKIMKRYYQNI